MTDLTNWSVEQLHDGYAQAHRMDRVLYDSKTDHQRIVVFDSALFGRVMTLDGVVQVTERDNFIYHEMLTHVPMIAHGAAKRVLIIGGGDGGMAREALRHPVDQVTMVEIDAGVVELSDILTSSDDRARKLHVTIQNKTDRETAQATQAVLRSNFTPWEGVFDSLLLWHYRGGPWERAGTFPFTGGRA